MKDHFPFLISQISFFNRPPNQNAEAPKRRGAKNMNLYSLALHLRVLPVSRASMKNENWEMRNGKWFESTVSQKTA
jgi:hypothetical protein